MADSVRFYPSGSPQTMVELEDDRGLSGRRRSINLSITTNGSGTFVRLTDDEAVSLAFVRLTDDEAVSLALALRGMVQDG